MSNTDFLDRAIKQVRLAIDADNAAQYDKAYQLYYQSLELFMLALKWEKNPKSKEMIRAKTGEYMDRAEKLKAHLSDSEAKRKKPGMNKPSIIFIDEIDALCGPRGEGESEASRRIKTEMLVQMDGVGKDSKGVLILGATNIPWQLDAAIRRRFQRRVHISLPDLAARTTMFKLAVGDTNTALKSEDFRELAKASEGYSGSDVSIVVQDALMQPVRKIQQATHFKKVTVDGQEKLTPCSPGDPEAIEMTWEKVASEQLLEPLVEKKDFIRAIKASRPTVSSSDLTRNEEWTKEFGSEGA
ncbi:Vacuolar protein sorting-associated protein 4 [Collariella sp. IMI 366227]|nr:Vacuolar protein sorting-associated protein 4 [Collariella sp. IMI 366227]